MSDFDADVAIIGSGFGGSVAALRFAEAGQRVVVLERGTWVRREEFRVGPELLWVPFLRWFGLAQTRRLGSRVWAGLGSAVGGGSHIYAGTLKRNELFVGFPEGIDAEELDPWYELAEDMMDVVPYPDYPPYSENRVTKLLYRAGAELETQQPELIESSGPLPLAIAFAPEGVDPSATFINKHGAQQRYLDPNENSILGGDIEAKNTLDLNYLFLAQEHGAEIRTFCTADKIECMSGGGFRVHYERRRDPEGGGEAGPASVTARRVVVAAGTVGSTELLLRNRDVHRTLEIPSPRLGHDYATNGNFLSLMFPFRGLPIAWLGVGLVVAALIGQSWWLAAIGAALYVHSLWWSREPLDPDYGPVNTDGLAAKGMDGATQGVYIESGRYPTPGKIFIAHVLSMLGFYRPKDYAGISRLVRLFWDYVPPFALIRRTWPILLLQMGKDRARGTFKLNRRGKLELSMQTRDNRMVYAWQNRIAKEIAKLTRSWFVRNPLYYVGRRIQVSHNLGGVCMADDPEHGVVDHAGRVFGVDDLMVLDGSTLPGSLGPNPTLTILALAERAMTIVLEQIVRDEVVRAATSAPARAPASVERDD